MTTVARPCPAVRNFLAPAKLQEASGSTTKHTAPWYPTSIACTRALSRPRGLDPCATQARRPPKPAVTSGIAMRPLPKNLVTRRVCTAQPLVVTCASSLDASIQANMHCDLQTLTQEYDSAGRHPLFDSSSSRTCVVVAACGSSSQSLERQEKVGAVLGKGFCVWEATEACNSPRHTFIVVPTKPCCKMWLKPFRAAPSAARPALVRARLIPRLAHMQLHMTGFQTCRSGQFGGSACWSVTGTSGPN
jgi:hypothetical protein